MKRTLAMTLVAAALSMNPAHSQDTLNLQESIKLALKNNYAVRNSTLEINAAEQTRQSALTSYFPNISASGLQFEAEKPLMQLGSDEPGIGLLEKGKIGYVNAVQPIFAGGRIMTGNKLARLGVDVSRFKDSLTRDEVILQTEVQYWQVISLEEKSRTITAYEEMLSSLLNQVEDAYHSGVVMRNDVLKVQLKKSEVLLNKSRLDNGLTLARMSFCRHVGLPLEAQPILSDSLVVGEAPANLRVSHAEALQGRSEYRLLELSVRAEKLQTRMTRGEYLPQVAVGAAYQYLNFDEGDSRSLGLVYGSISVPLSGWWGGSHELKKRKQMERIAENNRLDKSELLLLQMEKAWQDIDDAYTQYLLSEQSKEQATENMTVNQDSYDNGLIAVSDLLEARALLQQAEEQLIDAKTNYLIQRTRYLQVTGR